MQRAQVVIASPRPRRIAVSTDAITEIVGQAAGESCGAVASARRSRSR